MRRPHALSPLAAMGPMDVADARSLARYYLAIALPARWRHVTAVAARAEMFAERIDLDAPALISAAWLHDIGYSPRIQSVGFHPLDGARCLRATGWPDDVCDLVAHHTCARLEAERRGLLEPLDAEFVDRPSPERDALWAADATTGPDGQPLTLQERVDEVIVRYGREHVVSECMLAIRPELEAAITRTRARAVCCDTE